METMMNYGREHAIMETLRITGKADLKVFYDADSRLYNPAWLAARGLDEEGFIARYRDCPSIGFEQGGVPFGGIVLDGDDVHIAILPEFHGKWGTLLRQIFAWLFAQRSEVRCKVHRPNRQSLRFVRGLGAAQIACDDNFIIFKMSPEVILPAFLPRA
jgi:hypothetical protein